MMDRVDVAIQMLRDLEPPEGYFLAFSGGKDSVTAWKLCVLAGVKFDMHYSVTTIDPPELIYFMRDNFPDLVWDRPKVPFLVEMVKRGFPMRQRRWCCADYKERGGEGRFVITGVRAAESANRSKRKQIETCYRNPTKRYFHVIFKWSDDEVWNFIRKNNVPYCELYDEGFHRIGCLFCPYARRADRLAEVRRYPKFAEAFRRSFRLMYEKKKKEGKTSVDRWKDGDDMFDWWIDEKDYSPNQLVMFE